MRREEGSEKGGFDDGSFTGCSQEGKTALDFGQEGDDVKEALLSHRFSGEVSFWCPSSPPHLLTSSQELEDEYLHDRLPVLVERVTVRER